MSQDGALALELDAKDYRDRSCEAMQGTDAFSLSSEVRGNRSARGHTKRLEALKDVKITGIPRCAGAWTVRSLGTFVGVPRVALVKGSFSGSLPAFARVPLTNSACTGNASRDQSNENLSQHDLC